MSMQDPFRYFQPYEKELIIFEFKRQFPELDINKVKYKETLYNYEDICSTLFTYEGLTLVLIRSLIGIADMEFEYEWGIFNPSKK